MLFSELFFQGFEQRILLKKWAKDNRILEKEFQYSFEILKNNKLVTVEENQVKFEKLGQEFLNGDILHCELTND